MSESRELEQRYSPIDGTPYLAVKGTPETDWSGRWHIEGYDTNRGLRLVRPNVYDDWREAKAEIIRLTLDRPDLRWRATRVITNYD